MPRDSKALKSMLSTREHILLLAADHGGVDRSVIGDRLHILEKAHKTMASVKRRLPGLAKGEE
jgi:hypothetical protein